jgi:cytochrome c peroxidase
MTRTGASLLGTVAALSLAACSAPESDGVAAAALTAHAQDGERLFDTALGTNGRACATCHVEGEHTTLLPESVSARLAANPSDPLFDPLDVDDPTAPVPTYQHLQAGLVRVTLPLPPNVALIKADGTASDDRSISVWRGVPSVENTAKTGPYQLDGRARTLEDQALGALRAHSRIAEDPPDEILRRIADYERTVSSPPSTVSPPFAPGSDPAMGQALFEQGCAPCHGGPTGTRILDRAAAAPLHPALNPDGSVTLTTLPDGSSFPAHTCASCQANDFLNIGIAFGTYLGQIGAFPNATGVDYPHHRLRFYTDDTRAHPLVDLPPLPDRPGPNLAPQAFSTDPGRALITGRPQDFEAFDIPDLRGIAGTPPYFHDNSAPNLHVVLDIYSLFILPQLPALNLPRVVPPPPGSGLPPEALTEDQKNQIIAYLGTL